MIRTILKPSTQKISFDLPKNYIGQELEVIIFTKKEEIKIQEAPKKQATFNAISIDTTNYKFNRDEANER